MSRRTHRSAHELIEVESVWLLWSSSHVTLRRVLFLILEVLVLVQLEIVTDHVAELGLCQYWQLFHRDLGEKVKQLLLINKTLVILVRAKQELQLHVRLFLGILPLEKIEGLDKFVEVNNV